MTEWPVFARFQARTVRAGREPVLSAGNLRLGAMALASLVEANRLALQAQGLGPGWRIGWLGDNTPEMVAAFLACARLGAVFAPLDASAAPDVLARRVAAGGLHTVLATPDHAEQAAALRQHLPLRREVDDSLQPDDLLLSWTADGKVRLSGHARLLAVADAVRAGDLVAAHDRVLAALPLSSPAAWCLQVLPALLADAPLRLLASFEPAAWLAELVGWQPTSAVLSPAMLQDLQAHLAGDGAALAGAHALRRLVCWGVPANEGVLRTLRDQGLAVQLAPAFDGLPDDGAC